MKFDELDSTMRKYEQSLDQTILPDLYMAARIDGRNFTRLTKKICNFEAPFDERFRDYMVETVKHLMQCGFRIVYGYTESDEISLLFHPQEQVFSRKVRKYNSVLAGEASGAMSLQIGRVVCFDCRVIPLPTIERVKDYFLWRQEDAHRNALNAHCYWMLRKEGCSQNDATEALEGKSVAFKNELLFSRGINFDKLPSWQKRGIGVYVEDKEIEGFNPILGKSETAVRQILKVDFELPLRDDYAAMIADFISDGSFNCAE